MPKSVRLEPALAASLDRAARAVGVTHSEFIRDAVVRRCEEVLGVTLFDRLAGTLGTVRAGGGRARKTGAAFRRALAKKKR
jgi:DNA-binding transcriptional LysR family regulator